MATSAHHTSRSTAALRQLIRLLAVLEGSELSLWRRRDLTLTQLRALYRIHATGAATCGEVAEHLQMQASATTGLLDRLVQRGMVQRGARAGDRRVVEMQLTAAGTEAVAEIAAWRSGGLARALGQLDDDELESFAATAARLTRLLEEAEPEPALASRSRR